jgi:hypothetical protein
MRNGKDEGGPPDGSESQTSKGEHSWIKTVTDAASSWEEQQMEAENEWTSRSTKGTRSMNTQEILATAQQTISGRGKDYGDIRTSFTRAAIIASVTTNKNITPYDVALVMSAVKQARLAHDSSNKDSWVDSAAYQAIAAQLVDIPSRSNDALTAEVEAKLNEVQNASA